MWTRIPGGVRSEHADYATRDADADKIVWFSEGRNTLLATIGVHAYVLFQRGGASALMCVGQDGSMAVVDEDTAAMARWEMLDEPVPWGG